MSDPPLAGADWTDVEVAMQRDNARRWRRLRVALAVLLTLSGAALALVMLARLEVAQLARDMQPLVAQTGRLDAADAQLNQRLDRAEAQLVVVADALRTALQTRAQAPQKPERDADSAQSSPAELAPRPRAVAVPQPMPLPAALRDLPAAQSRLDDAVQGLDQRVQRAEATAASALAGQDRVEARLARIDDALVALERSARLPQTPASADTQTPPLLERVDALQRRLARLERVAVRSGASDYD